jgi:hypothetical protein
MDIIPHIMRGLSMEIPQKRQSRSGVNCGVRLQSKSSQVKLSQVKALYYLTRINNAILQKNFVMLRLFVVSFLQGVSAVRIWNENVQTPAFCLVLWISSRRAKQDANNRDTGTAETSLTKSLRKKKRTLLP